MSDDLQKQQSRFSLAGKVAVVTGGHRGIGRDISLGIARAGGDIIVIDRKGPGDSDVPSLIHALGRKHWSFIADLGDVKALQAAAEQAKAAVEAIDILVNNSGISAMASATELTLEQWNSVININLRAPFLLSQIFAKGENGMLARGKGAIVNVSSLVGTRAVESHAAYGASKAGLNMLTQVITTEWAAKGIRANAVAPTVVLSDMGRMVWDNEKGEALKKRIPAQRFVELHEVADAVVFLASDAASMINGEILHVDGGLHVL